MDYEFDGYGALAAEYDKVRPPFEETLSPCLPRGLNLGKQVFYMERQFPAEFKAARAFLGYPQYWSWRLSGVAATEFTSVASHTDLWRPMEGRLSSMVDELGWRRLFPPMRKAWDTLGTLKPEIAAATGLAPNVRVVCGAHDSNASLVPHLMSRRDPFTVISTGTWVIIMAVGGKGGSTRKPTCWPMSMCAAFRCRPRASWAGENLRSLPAKRRPTPAKPTSPA